MATSFPCSGEEAAPEVSVRESAKLHDLTDAQIEHVSLGLVRSFDYELIREGSFFLVPDLGKRRMVSDSLTVMDVWNLAKEWNREEAEE